MSVGAALTFRDAVEADVESLVEIVHAAYRSGPEAGGWTTESHLLGGQRTDAEGVRAVMSTPGGRLLVAEQGGEPVGCCQLESRESDGARTAYFGMFAVRPRQQGGGLGTAVMAEAERLARVGGAEHMEMTVLAQRSDLIAFYERRGFTRTGQTEPFPYGDERFGLPHVDDLHFVVLRKRL